MKASFRMRATAITLLILTSPATLSAQVDFTARAGVTWSSTLVEDEIAASGPITVKAGIAPTLVLGASLPATATNRVSLELAFARSDATVEDDSGDHDLTTLGTVGVSLGFDGPLASGVRWRLGLGALNYLPAEEVGVFREGGPWRWMAGGGLDWAQKLSESLDLVAAIRYDYHRFTTDALEAQGFANPEGVHRVALTVGVGGRP